MSADLSPELPQFWRVARLAKRCGVERTTIWRWQQAGRLPQPVRLSPTVVGWWETDIIAALKAAGLAPQSKGGA